MKKRKKSEFHGFSVDEIQKIMEETHEDLKEAAKTDPLLADFLKNLPDKLPKDMVKRMAEVHKKLGLRPIRGTKEDIENNQGGRKMKTLREMKKDLDWDYQGKEVSIKCVHEKEPIRCVLFGATEDEVKPLERQSHYKYRNGIPFNGDNDAIQHVIDVASSRIIYNNPLILNTYNGYFFQDLINIADELISRGKTENLLKESLKLINPQKFQEQWPLGFIAWKMLINIYDTEKMAEENLKSNAITAPEFKTYIESFSMHLLYNDVYRDTLQDKDIEEFLNSNVDDDDGEESKKDYFGLCFSDMEKVVRIVTCHYENKNGMQFDEWWNMRFQNLLKELKITHIDHKTCRGW